ncbi:MAG: hypothetical protein AB7G40_10145 [Hyphomonadaceae bacterium]
MHRTKTILAGFLALACVASDASAQSLRSYDCQVARKFRSDGTEYSGRELEQWQFSVRVIESAEGVILQRCSFTSAEARVTCDSYRADHVELDAQIGARKYYYFRGQFDLQIFSDGTFLENNGRGSVALGSCSVQ